MSIGSLPQVRKRRFSGSGFGDRFRFPRELGLVNMQVDRFQHFGIRGNFLAGFHKNHVADHQILLRYKYKTSGTNSLDRRGIIDSVQNIELFPRPIFVQKRDSRCKENRQQDTDAFDHCSRKRGDQRGGDQNDDNRIPEFFCEQLPGGLSPGRFQKIGSVLRPAGGDFVFR